MHVYQLCSVFKGRKTKDLKHNGYCSVFAMLRQAVNWKHKFKSRKKEWPSFSFSSDKVVVRTSPVSKYDERPPTPTPFPL